MFQSKSFRIIIVGCGALIAGTLACSTGGQAGSSDSTATLVAPGTEASGASSMPTIDPCSIVTQDEAAALFGAPSGTGDPGVGSLTATCDYRSTDNTDALDLILMYVPDGALNSSQFNYMKQGNQDVPGLGDGAAWVSGTRGLDVAKGKWILTLNGTLKGQGMSLDTLKTLAQTALGRLP